VVDVSVEREVDVDLEENSGIATIVERRELDKLFEDGQLRLWEDSAGWSGFVREETEGGDVAYFHVNTRHDEDTWIGKVRVGERAVASAAQEQTDAVLRAGRLPRR